MGTITVAIDGPAGAGKSSVAKCIAKRLQYLYIDTGAMYRAFTWAVLHHHVDITDEQAVRRLVETIDIRLVPEPDVCRVYVNGQEVTEEIRQSDVATHVSAVAALAVVREKLVQLQRKMAAKGNVILDGRDIGTVVLPKATVKIFLTASVASRAKRRFLEVQAHGEPETLAEIQANIAARDDMDSHRAIAPLKQAADAVLVDNSSLTLEETADVIIDLIRSHVK